MIALLQRVSRAKVEVAGAVVAEIHGGLLVFLGLERGDDEAAGCALLMRVVQYRVFADGRGQMNQSLQDTQGALLLVPQFTLAADTRRGRRPAFSRAMAPELSRPLFESLVRHAQTLHGATQAGIFGASMQVSLVNDGPVTFWLQSATAGRPED